MKKKKYYSSFAGKIFFSILGLVLFFAASISVGIYYYFIKASDSYHIEILEIKESSILKSIDYLIDTSIEPIDSKNFGSVLKNKIFELRDVNKVHINIFSLDKKLLLSTEPYNEKYIAKSFIQNKITEQLQISERVLLKMPSEKGINHLESYKIVRNSFSEPLGIVNLSFYSENDFLNSEYFSLLKILIVIILINSILIVLASWALSNKLTQRLSEVAESIKNFQLFNNNNPIVYSGEDEVSILVDAYNELREKVKIQSEELIKSERENAWKEMAKQVAHEIKNPLTPMLLMIQNFNRKFLQEDEKTKKEVQQLCESISVQIESLKSISEAFSSFANTPTRKDENFDLVDATKKIIEIFGDLSIQFYHNLPTIFYTMDKVYWNRILTNLITNSKQAIPDGREPKITINLIKEDKYIYLSITDNGEGIKTEDFDKVFQPKFTTKNSGMGLGLSMIKKMTEEYNSTISVENNESLGCTFTIKLPL